jgi:hypothetical protein
MVSALNVPKNIIRIWICMKIKKLNIRDVIRIGSNSSGSSLETIKSQLNRLGWHDDYIDYGIIQLIQACYQDEV